MTTYILRTGCPRTHRHRRRSSSALVSTRKGPRVVAPGARASQRRTAASSRPLLASLGFEAKQDQVVTVPTGGTPSRHRCSSLVGLGDAATAPRRWHRRRRVRGPRAAARAADAASVALALPADDAALVRAVLEGYLLGAYRFDSYRTGPRPTGPAEVVVLSRRRPATRSSTTRSSRAQVARLARSPAPATGSTPRPAT